MDGALGRLPLRVTSRLSGPEPKRIRLRVLESELTLAACAGCARVWSLRRGPSRSQATRARGPRPTRARPSWQCAGSSDCGTCRSGAARGTQRCAPSHGRSPGRLVSGLVTVTGRKATSLHGWGWKVLSTGHWCNQSRGRLLGGLVSGLVTVKGS